ncbi:MAG: hypothetical protein LC101_11570 [Flavobacteriales bacterium]|nr:hypothetical protein [Flavobacteriales bacterium]
MEIHLDISDFSAQTLNGYCLLDLQAKVNNINSIKLDLMQLTVDSVKSGSQLLAFSQQLGSFTITLPATYNTGDNFQIQIFYGGTPFHDVDFGGFYFSSNYAYSVGVSLSNIPHNYGRTWFPCFDNFTERCTYDLFITTTDTRKAVCGGILQSVTPDTPGKSTWHWLFTREIPSYLISVAVSDYEFVKTQFISINNDTIPVILAARGADTTKLKNSFINLHQAFDIFEQRFGPYLWDRVGYVLVPMTAGAMEHAENIAYPVILANNNTAYQDVMAHELSHHWWGNLITCRTAEDMWINEGMAAYCEYVFNEGLFGYNQYKNMVRTAHKKNLQMAHVDDDGYWPLSGIPQNHTYSTTTYLKGADIAHTLRGYLGDSLFFGALNHVLQQFAYHDVDAWQFRDAVSAFTGIDASPFFDDWIFQGGWPWFGIDSTIVQPAGVNYQITLHARQKLAGRALYAHQAPIEIAFYDAGWQPHIQTFMFDGYLDTFLLTLPFIPQCILVDPNERISYAVTTERKILKSTGSTSLSHANFTVTVNQITDSAMIVVSHNWVGADPLVPSGATFTVSPQRYWTVDGIWPAGFSADANISYNGKTNSTGYLDHLLIGATEDSLILVYRPSAHADWIEWPNYTKNIGSLSDKVGTIVIHQIQKGEYALAYKSSAVSLPVQADRFLHAYPNPSKGEWTIEWDTQVVSPFDYWQITDISGKQLLSNHEMVESPFLLSAQNLPEGHYFLSFGAKGKILAVIKIVRQ